jgi:hypothetical protein
MTYLVEMAQILEHRALERRAKAEPRAANGAALKRLRRFVRQMLEQQVRKR